MRSRNPGWIGNIQYSSWVEGELLVAPTAFLIKLRSIESVIMSRDSLAPKTWVVARGEGVVKALRRGVENIARRRINIASVRANNKIVKVARSSKGRPGLPGPVERSRYIKLGFHSHGRLANGEAARLLRDWLVKRLLLLLGRRLLPYLPAPKNV